MKFRLVVDMSNAAFGATPLDAADEIARILRRCAKEIENTQEVPEAYASLFDINGNYVGRYAQRKR